MVQLIIRFIYQVQHTIVELATPNREQWHFLPSCWRNPIHRKQIFFVDRNFGLYTHELGCLKNFALFGFLPWYTYPKNTGDLLVLNLNSRKKFWLQKEKLHNEIRSRNLRTSRYGLQWGGTLNRLVWPPRRSLVRPKLPPVYDSNAYIFSKVRFLRTRNWDTVLTPRGYRDENREEYKRWQRTPATGIEIKLDSQMWANEQIYLGSFSFCWFLRFYRHSKNLSYK